MLKTRYKIIVTGLVLLLLWIVQPSLAKIGLAGAFLGLVWMNLWFPRD